MKFILGKKIGMTRIFDRDSKTIPVTVVQTGPCDITQIKNKNKDGYDSIQLVFDKKKNASKAVIGHLRKSKTKQNKHIKEIRLNKIADLQNTEKSSDNTEEYKIGDKITVGEFKNGDMVKVTGISKGKGFAGVMKRYNFKGAPASHGHQKPRSGGSIGCRYPQRTIKGKRMPGHMGVDRITTKGLKIVDIDIENNLLAISGAIPGPNKSLVQIIGEE